MQQSVSPDALEARVCFIDDVYPPFTTDDAAIAMTFFRRFERVNNFHNSVPKKMFLDLSAGT